MAKHIVKCAICNESFDCNIIQAVKYNSRRYAHESCFPQGEKVPLLAEQKDKNLIELEEYIKLLFNESFVNPRIRKQINKYIEEYNYSYSGILKSLKWFYEVENHSIDESGGGIGIVPYVYDKAKNYYYNLYLAQEVNKNVTISTNKEIIEVTIPLPKIENKLPKLFNI